MLMTDQQLDLLTEMINIGIGRGASVLNSVLGSHIQLNVPMVKILTPKELEKEMNLNDSENLSAVNMPFNGPMTGNAELIFPSESASKLVQVFTDDEDESQDLDTLRAGALCEIGNVVLNAIMGSISNILEFHFNYTVPSYLEGTLDQLFPRIEFKGDKVILLIRTRFTVRELEVQGDIILFLKMGSFEKLFKAMEKLNHSGETV